MTAGMVQTPSSPDQEGSLLDAQGYLHRDYPQSSWDYTAAVDHNPLAPPNGMWQGGLPCYDTPTAFETPLNGAIWPHYGTATADGAWDPQVDGPPSFAAYGPAWPLSPADTLSNNPWSPTDQPLPSPLSEVPSYALTQSPWGEDQATTRSGTNSPITIPTNSTLLTPVLKPKDKTKKNRDTNNLPPKRPAETTARPPRPRTLKRHKSDTPSISSILTDRTTGSTSTTASTTTTLGGVLPANVDPRVAAEQIRREAWERCKAEALEMSQRRMMLLDHEHGALERETQRLQVNLGRMREVAKRERAGGLEEEEGDLEEAGRWVDGGS
ncbi:hypothetical protein C8A01DRAFT_31426 [Parachaetomium inaequale]|uniref:Uncharacterized protein n=1 Tax=Parachaetomium inaequale TaxID=2588326 RepID=A0AAN6PT55_9PEZI|nr:hypothetical protein C8A01DRAFT_31426 [Parachaetomium inaequale]